MKREKVLISWSGGKDSFMTFFELKDPGYKIVGLLSSLEIPSRRLKGHGIREDVLLKQAASLKLPLQWVELREEASNNEYEEGTLKAMNPWIAKGVKALAFGDLHLEDIRTYREQAFHPLGIKTLFPLWKVSPADLTKQFISFGFEAIICAVNAQKLDHSFLGRKLDKEFLNDLPKTVDPAGEGGEFHSFVYDGPFFDSPLSLDKGEIFEKGEFAFLDLRLRG